MEGSLVFLDQVRGSDDGQFKITDILGFTVSSIHLEVLRKDGDGLNALWKHVLSVSSETFLHCHVSQYSENYTL